MNSTLAELFNAVNFFVMNWSTAVMNSIKLEIENLPAKFTKFKLMASTSITCNKLTNSTNLKRQESGGERNDDDDDVQRTL